MKFIDKTGHEPGVGAFTGSPEELGNAVVAAYNLCDFCQAAVDYYENTIEGGAITVANEARIAIKGSPAVWSKTKELAGNAWGKVKGLFSRGAGGASEVKNFALGLSDHLDDFAASQGAKTWKDFPNPENWKSTVLDNLNNSNVQIQFNLTGIDSPWASVSRAARGGGGATDWELLQIKSNPQVWSKITWYENGRVVPNPFE